MHWGGKLCRMSPQLQWRPDLCERLAAPISWNPFRQCWGLCWLTHACQKYNRRASGVSIYSATKQSHSVCLHTVRLVFHTTAGHSKSWFPCCEVGGLACHLQFFIQELTVVHLLVPLQLATAVVLFIDAFLKQMWSALTVTRVFLD